MTENHLKLLKEITKEEPWVQDKISKLRFIRMPMQDLNGEPNAAVSQITWYVAMAENFSFQVLFEGGRLVCLYVVELDSPGEIHDFPAPIR